MTTTIKVTPHNYPACVQTYERLWDVSVNRVSDPTLVSEQILRPEDGERVLYCATTRELRITDLEYDDPKVKALPPKA